MRKFDTIIFDLDGTLLNTLDDLRNSVNAALKEFGYQPCSTQEVRSYVGNGAVELIRLALPGGLQNSDFDSVLAFFKRHYKNNCNILTAPYPGVIEVLRDLRDAGLKTAIVSNKPDDSVKKLADIHFPGLIDIAEGENEAKGIRRKPYPDSVNAVLAYLGTDKSRAVYVGDSDVDIKTAENAHLQCVSVLWGFCDRPELENAGAENYINIPAELEKFIFD